MTTKRVFEGKDNYGKPRSEYVTSIEKMDDDALFKETKSKIWLSAYASNNPRSDYHWHVDAIYDEWVSRGKLERYSEAYEKVRRENGG
jgi:hypothetical protein